jgi:heterodisulfide reductase subunit A
MSEARVGVFVCDCGNRIQSVVDTEAITKQMIGLPDVTSVRRLPYACSPDGIAAIQAAIAEEKLDRVLVAGCPPRTMGAHLRAAVEEAGLPGDCLDLADIREGCAWVHSDDPHAATIKATEVIRMGIARLALREPAEPVSADVIPAALVIGGGIAGLTAALTLADAGVQVTLVEREPALGGMLRHANTLFPDRRSAAELLAEPAQRAAHHPNITVRLSTRIEAISGSAGHYTVRLEGNTTPVDVGAIIVATGAHPAEPHGLFGHDGARVVTQLEFERELRNHSHTHQDGLPDRVVMLLCAGQRNGQVPYCSGVCCMGAINQALEIKAAHPDADVTILFRDLYLMGDAQNEEQVLQARRSGVKFVRYAPASPPRLTGDGIALRDEATGAAYEVPFDRLVLATPLVAQRDAGQVAHLLKIGRDDHGFFPETRYRLRPHKTLSHGVFVCGAAHHPASWQEAEFQAMSAAFNALRFLQAGVVSLQAPIAEVDAETCTGCGTCAQVCAFDAISMRQREGLLDLSQVDPLRCQGCGNCVVACPVKAIHLPGTGDAEILAQIDEALADRANGASRILVFGCEWSGHAAAELAGARKMGYPVETRLIRMGCSARFDPVHVLWALFQGADGVFLGACPPGQCHYVNGNAYAQERFAALRAQLDASSFDPRRLRLEWITPDDPAEFVRKIADFTQLVSALGPNPARSERLVLTG